MAGVPSGHHSLRNVDAPARAATQDVRLKRIN